MKKIIIARKKVAEAVDCVETLRKVFENDGKFEVEGLCEDVPELGGKIYGLTYIIPFASSRLSLKNFQKVCSKLSSMGPEQLSEFVGMSKDEIGDQICDEYNISIDDKNFSGGADLIGENL